MYRRAILTGAILALTCSLASAQTVWTGANNSSWNNGLNWSTGLAPTIADDVIVPVTPTQPIVVSAALARDLTIQNGAVVTVNWNGSMHVQRDLEIQNGLTTTGLLQSYAGQGPSYWVGGDWDQDKAAGFSPANSTVSFGGTSRFHSDDETIVFGDVLLEAGCSLEVSTDLEVAGDWTSTAAGATVTGNGWILFSGNAAVSTGANSLGNVEIQSGVRQVITSHFKHLRVTGGELRIWDDQTLTVNGQADLLAGQLSFYNLTSGDEFFEVFGTVNESGTTPNITSGDAHFRVHGTWNGTGAFLLASGTVEMFGPSTIGGSAPAFQDLTLVSGVTTIAQDTRIYGDLLSSGGQTTGARRMLMDGSTTVSMGSNTLDKLEVVSGVAHVSNSTVNDLWVTGGELRIMDDQTLTVNGDARLSAGEFSLYSLTSGLEVFEVFGALIETGTTTKFFSSESRIRCYGSWMGDGLLTLASGWVEAYGPVVIGGSAPTFVNLKLMSGNTALQSDVTMLETLTATSGTSSGAGVFDFVGGAATLDVPGGGIHAVRVSAGMTYVKNSSVDEVVVTGGELRIGDDVKLTVPGDFVATGGQLSWYSLSSGMETLEVFGDVDLQNTTVNFSSAEARLYFHGQLRSDGGVRLGDGWVETRGPATSIAGVQPSFDNLLLAEGITTLLTPAEIDRDLKVSGGDSIGAEPFRMVGSGASLHLGTTTLHRVEVAAGLTQVFNSAVEELDITGGELRIADDQTLTVETLASLTGGAISWWNLSFGAEVLDINGDAFINGTVVNHDSTDARLRCAGNWSSVASFNPTSGIVEFDGANPANIGGPSPHLTHVRFIEGTKTLMVPLRIDGTVTTSGTGTTTGPAAITMVGATASIPVGTNPMHKLRIEAGLTTSANNTFGELEIVGGEFRINDDQTVTVSTRATLTGGALSWWNLSAGFEVLDVNGDVEINGTVTGHDSTDARLRCEGNWTSVDSFNPPNAIVEFDGGVAADISGPSLHLSHVRFTDGIKYLLNPLNIDKTVATVGTGATSGPAAITMVGSGASILAGSNPLHKVRVEAGVTTVNTVSIGDLEIAGGKLRINDDQTLSVSGDASFGAGTLEFYALSAGAEVLDVEGNVTTIATSVISTNDSIIRCAGDWFGNSIFSMTAGKVELDGTGTTSIVGALPTLSLTFPKLSILNGERKAGGNLTLNAASIAIPAGATLSAGSATLSIPALPLSVDGTLAVGPGGTLDLTPASPITINAGGRLQVVGAPGLLASVEGSGYACQINGELAAQNFHFGNMAPSGIVLGTGSTLAAAPNDLRGGEFDFGTPGPTSVLLDLQQPAAHTFAFVNFLNTSGTGAMNVRRTSGAPCAFLNWGGSFAGATYEDDPNALINWLPPALTLLDHFTAGNGPEELRLEWLTTQEYDVQAFVVEWALDAAGPWFWAADYPPAGAGLYQKVLAPVPPDMPLFVRLSERVSFGHINILATDTATAYSAAMPSTVLTVGPSGTFATLQAAVDAATGPANALFIEAGTYAPFTIAAPVGSVHLYPDGSGPVIINTLAAPIEILNVPLGGAVELSKLMIGQPAGAGPAVRVLNSAGLIVLDKLAVDGGGGAGLEITGSPSVMVQSCAVVGAPGIDLVGGGIYAGRGAVDVLDVAAGARAALCQLTPGVLNAAPGSHVVTFPGIMPSLTAPKDLQPLGEAFTLDIAAAPGTFFQVGLSGSYFPLDLQNPVLWQMLLGLNPVNYTVVASGLTDPVTGLASVPAEVPPEGVYLGARLAVQAWTIGLVPNIEVRFSNIETLFTTP